MPFLIVRDDIARVSADAVVNAANPALQAGGGVCGALFAAAGAERMREACDAIGGCPTGSAVVTPGFDLDAKWCIHAVGPVWRGGGEGEREALRSCYRSVFAQVERLGARSVAFPLISAGIFGFPVDEALSIAREEAEAFLAHRDEVEATLVVFDRAVVRAGSALFDQAREYIDDGYVDASPHMRDRLQRLAEEPWLGAASAPMTMAAAAPRELDELLDDLDASFSETLLALIDERGLTDAQVYHRANLSRQLFSKIRGNRAYRPTKATAVALAVALELDLDQTQDLLGRAGLALSRSSRFDVIVRFFLERGIHDVFRMNEVLFAYDQPLLGSQG